MTEISILVGCQSRTYLNHTTDHSLSTSLRCDGASIVFVFLLDVRQENKILGSMAFIAYNISFRMRRKGNPTLSSALKILKDKTVKIQRLLFYLSLSVVFALPKADILFCEWLVVSFSPDRSMNIYSRYNLIQFWSFSIWFRVWMNDLREEVAHSALFNRHPYNLIRTNLCNK